MIFLTSNFDSSILIFIFITVAIVLIFISYYFGSKQKVLRTLSKLQDKRIMSLKSNEFSRVTGKALHVKTPLLAPYSKRKCIFYSIKIEQKNSSGKNKYWRTIIKEEKAQEFFLEKNGDFVIVKPNQNPKNYLSHLVVDKKTNSGTFKDPTPKFETLLNHYNIKSEGFFGFNKTLRYSEAVIEIGEQITVAGIAKWKSLKEAIDGYSYSKIVELESSDKQKLIITDLPNIKSKKRL
ncbi:hypothetical protein [uncultured Polaribacter sp.]|uniref:hypothetical protein n=1 Tax=uncultured Polaribacter sp. TaxID=174711 RepID=UPI00259AF4DC|nr:hypothetical protein [uncultured Polaribacter sp.]